MLVKYIIWKSIDAMFKINCMMHEFWLCFEEYNIENKLILLLMKQIRLKSFIEEANCVVF